MRKVGLVSAVLLLCLVGSALAQMGGGWGMGRASGHVISVAPNHRTFQMNWQGSRVTMYMDPYAPNPRRLQTQIGHLRPGQSVTIWCYSGMCAWGWRWYVSQIGGPQPPY